SPGDNPFCAYLSDQDSSSRSSSRKVASSGPSSGQIKKWLEQGKIENLKNASDRNIYRALKKIKSVAAIDKAAEKLIQSSQCNTSGFSLYLGAKLKELFPDPELRKRASQVYESALLYSGHESV